MAKRLFDKQSIVADSLATLRRINTLQKSPIDAEIFKNQQFIDYINRDFNENPEADKIFEKIIATAAYNKAKDSKFILSEHREEFARKAVDEVRWIKLQANQDKIPKFEYDVRSEVNSCTEMLGKLNVAKKFLKRRGKKIVADTILTTIAVIYPPLGVPASIVYLGGRLINWALPKEKKEKIKKNVKEFAKKAGEKIVSSLQTMKNYGKKIASKVVDKLAEGVQKVEKGVVKVVDAVVKPIKNVLVKTKEMAKKTWGWLKEKAKSWQ